MTSSESRRGAPPAGRRLTIALLLGAVAAVVAWDHARRVGAQRDFTQVWFAARALLHGQHPYALIGPGLAFDWPYPFLYPLTAGVLVTPLAPLPQTIANGVFMFIGASAFAWVLMRHGYGTLVGFFSASMLVAVEVVQWSPLFAAAVIIPPLGIALAAKPTIGLAIFAARPSRWAILGGAVLAALAWVTDPAWVAHWFDAIHRNAVINREVVRPISPLVLPGGVLVLTALTRWRRPEARLLVVLACVPQTLMPYETVPLFLIPTALHEAVLLTALSWGALTWISMYAPADDFARFVALSRPAMVVALYLPATLLVLRRPNEGPVPAWLESAIRYLPPALRGRPQPELTPTA